MQQIRLYPSFKSVIAYLYQYAYYVKVAQARLLNIPTKIYLQFRRYLPTLRQVIPYLRNYQLRKAYQLSRLQFRKRITLYRSLSQVPLLRLLRLLILYLNTYYLTVLLSIVLPTKLISLPRSLTSTLRSRQTKIRLYLSQNKNRY